MFKPVQTGSNRFTRAQIGSNGDKWVQTCSKGFKWVQNRNQIGQLLQMGLNLGTMVQTSSYRVNPGQMDEWERDTTIRSKEHKEQVSHRIDVILKYSQPDIYGQFFFLIDFLLIAYLLILLLNDQSISEV